MRITFHSIASIIVQVYGAFLLERSSGYTFQRSVRRPCYKLEAAERTVFYHPEGWDSVITIF
jgi:hypothetical protein